MNHCAAYCRVKTFKKEIKEFLYNYNSYINKPEMHVITNNMLSIINYNEIGDYHSAIFLLREFNWYLAELMLFYSFFEDDFYNIIKLVHKATCKALDNDFKFEYINKNNNCIVSYDFKNKFEMERIDPKVTYLDTNKSDK